MFIERYNPALEEFVEEARAFNEKFAAQLPKGPFDLTTPEGLASARNIDDFDSLRPRESLIQAEDRVVLYTDGIPETKSPSEQEFGTARFIKFMENNRSLAVDHFADGLLDELSRWSEQPRGQGQQDDITVLTIDFK